MGRTSWWPLRYLAHDQTGRFAPVQAVNFALAILMVAGLVNLAFTFAIIRESAKIRNGLNLVVGAISIMALLFMLAVGVQMHN